jgi:uncharacterized protein
MARAEPMMMKIEVLYCPRPGVVDTVQMQFAEPTSLAMAVRASGVLERHGLDGAAVRVGVWNHVRDGDFALRDGDRVEIYRPLTVDPKEARRLRYKRHREASASARGAKAGLAR